MQLTRWQRLRTRAYLFAIGVKRHVTLGVRGVLIDGDRVFLIRHTYLPGWQFPGGGVEAGETAEQSVAREMLEETGYSLRGRPVLFGLYHNSSLVTDRDHVALYVCRDFIEARRFEPNHEIADAGWFAQDALPAGTTESAGRRIAEIFGGGPISPGW